MYFIYLCPFFTSIPYGFDFVLEKWIFPRVFFNFKSRSFFLIFNPWFPPVNVSPFFFSGHFLLLFTHDILTFSSAFPPPFFIHMVSYTNKIVTCVYNMYILACARAGCEIGASFAAPYLFSWVFRCKPYTMLATPRPRGGGSKLCLLVRSGCRTVSGVLLTGGRMSVLLLASLSVVAAAADNSNKPANPGTALSAVRYGTVPMLSWSVAVVLSIYWH
jgi:hypothetical protein